MSFTEEIRNEITKICSISLENDSAVAARAPPGSYKIGTDPTECRWEAIEAIFQHLTQHSISPYISLLLAKKTVDEHLQEILTTLEPQKLVTESDYAFFQPALFNKTVLARLYRSAEEWCSPKDAQTNGADREVALPRIDKKVSIAAVKNTRRTMEDRHVVVPNLELLFENKFAQKDSFFAVYDGHNGQECANYAAAHLLANVVDSPHYQSNPIEALRSGMIKTDETLCAKCEQEHIKSGATAVCALVRDNLLCLAWLGDSQAAVSGSDGKINLVTDCHSPDSPEEYQRIEKEGGMVLCVQGEMRVNGVLNLSRSLGDCYIKPVISGEPDVLEIELTGCEDYLILGCDGLWDSVDPEECDEVITEFITNHKPTDFGKISDDLVERAKANGSTDNITALVVFLNEPEVIWNRQNH